MANWFWQEAKVHSDAHPALWHGRVRGRAYETATGPAIFRLKEHTDRLFNSARIMNMKIPFTKDEVNGTAGGGGHQQPAHAYLRPVVP